MQHQTFAHETPRQIEARLDEDRKALSKALAALGAKFTRNALLSDGLSLIKSNSGPYVQVLDRAIRTNPLAVVLSSIGLVWMILGRRTTLAADSAPLPGTLVEAVARWEDEGGPVSETLAETPGADDSGLKDADQLRTRATALIWRIDAASRKNAAPADELAIHRADTFAALTKDVRRVMARGLDHLSDDARDLALVGRERTYTQHVLAPKSATAGLHDRPLTTGAAFVVAGATLAALLPQSIAESRALSAPRDHLAETLRDALQDERQRLANTLQKIAQVLSSSAT